MKAVQTIMGLPISVELVDTHHSTAALEAVWSEFRRIDRKYSPYLPSSDVSRLNHGELTPQQLDLEMQTVLAACEAWRVRSHGVFNARRPDGHLDPSGYVKGWAIYRAARLLDQHYVSRYCINAGGDIQVRGEAPGGGPWLVGIEHPFQPHRFAKILALKNCAVATSGLRHRGSHIYDPRTGTPVDEPVSVTVIGARIAEVDTLATIAFVMGETGLSFIQQYDCQGLLIQNQHRVMITPGFRRYDTLVHP